MGVKARAVVLGLLGWGASIGCALAMDRLHYQEYPELDGKVIRQVVFLGNEKTRDLVLRREMFSLEGEEFQSTLLWRDWERLQDLGLFANLEVEALSSEDGVLVVVNVIERPRFFAAPLLDYNIDSGSATYGYTIRARNLNGLNQSLNHRVRLGQRNRASVSFSTPWLGPRRQQLDLSANIDFGRPGRDELLSKRVRAATTSFLGDYRRVRQGITVFGGMERLTREDTHPSGGVDQLSPSVGVSWSRDSRNVRIDPSRGTQLLIAPSYVAGWIQDDLEYSRTAIDLRGFRQIGDWVVLAGRANSILTKGRVPDYRRIFIGGAGTVRGQPDEFDQGNSLVLLAAEVRFPLLPRRRFQLPLPWVPRSIKNFDLRVDGALFVDSGTAWESREDVGSTKFGTGAGFGLRIFLPVLELVRLEFAFDESGNFSFYFREGNRI